MSLSGNFNTNKYSTSSSGTIGLNLSWTGTQSVVDNSTTISWTLKSNGTMSSGYCVWGGPITVVIGGKTVLSQTSRVRVYGGGAYKKTGTVIIPHNEDGTKSCAMSVKAALYDSSVNCTGSYTYTLDAITRYALLSTVENFNDEVSTSGYPTITYINPAGTDLVTGLKGRISWNSGANYTSWVTLNDEGGTYTFTSSTLTSSNISDMLSACTTANSLPVQFELQSTLNSTTYTHTKDAVMSVINANPTSGAVTFQDTDATTVGKTGSNQIIVQGQSVLKIMSAVSTAKKSATIVSYSLSFNGTTTDITTNRYLTISQPNIAGIYPATVTTTDSRGNTSTASINITIHELVPPSATYSLKRVDNFYSNTILYVDGYISSVSGTNTRTITERHKKKSDATWSTATTVQNATNTTLSLDNTYEWEVEITITDEYYTGNSATKYIASVGVGLPICFFDKKRHSVAVNGFPDADNQLYVGGSIKATGGLSLGTPLPVASGGTGASTTVNARANLGMGCDLIMDENVSSGSKMFANAGYTVLLVIARTTSSGSHNTLVVPMGFLDSSNNKFCIADDTDWVTFFLRVENDTITLTWDNRKTTGYIEKVYGII